MNIGLHHLVKSYKLACDPTDLVYNKTFCRFINHFIYIVGFFSIVILLPQLFNILASKDAKGVSVITWIGFFLSSSFWLFYGIIHKEKPIILTNTAALIVDFLIIVAIFVYS